ncbi:hypothetical protein [Cupriavidus sp. IDO]|uniref:hypothetical protein n=1 Tax=Cupriavidus sp. IDO TaxID=1539142 RepID=UPI000ACA1C38|nr:hypothetical protein [Cupriavidus sp. IDO]
MATAEPSIIGADIRALIANDGYAITFQTMGQYRTALLQALDSLPSAALAAAEPVAWCISMETARALAAELVRGAESMGDDESELILEVRRPGTVSDDDGTTNERSILAVSLAEYPEEGVYPIDPADPTGGRVDAAPAPAEPFQARVQPWMLECFGAEIAADQQERNHRFLEEALELVQSCGATASEAHQLVDYVYGRPVGEKHQEVGGVMVTLAALCLAQGLDMHAAGETELARIWTKVEQIRAKQAAKPKHSPLPQHVPAAPPAGQVDGVRKLLTAASHALRSYQYGNAAPDLAESIADRIDVAMSATPTTAKEAA